MELLRIYKLKKLIKDSLESYQFGEFRENCIEINEYMDMVRRDIIKGIRRV